VPTALVDAARRHDLPLDELRVYMTSMRVDCAPVRIRDDAELDRYMNGSAAAVGRIMAPLIGAPERAGGGGAAWAWRSSWPTFVRDVREDWTLDRVYLPGLPESDLQAADAGDGFREHVRAPGRPRPRDVRRDARHRRGGQRPRAPRDVPRTAGSTAVVLDRVERADYDVLTAVTQRATARGAERTSLDGDRADVLICGASFAGLAVARELAGAAPTVLLIDRYAIGERQTSACAVPRAG
jgi:phytoene synthase